MNTLRQDQVVSKRFAVLHPELLPNSNERYTAYVAAAHDEWPDPGPDHELIVCYHHGLRVDPMPTEYWATVARGGWKKRPSLDYIGEGAAPPNLKPNDVYRRPIQRVIPAGPEARTFL